MKTLILAVVTLISVNSFANCRVDIKRLDTLQEYLSLHEIERILENRGYYLAQVGEDFVDNHLDVNVQVACIMYERGTSDFEMWLAELTMTTAIVVMKTNMDGLEKSFDQKIKGSITDLKVKRKFKKLVKNLPICRD